MIKRIFAVAVIPAIVFSCNNAAENKKNAADELIKAERNARLVYLDAEENMYSLLCQGWVMEDDGDALSGMNDDSKFEIPYRSFYLAANGTFVKNPRNAMDHGNWYYDDAKKTITLTYSPVGGKDTYKIAALAYDEMKLLNTGVNTGTILKFISSGKRFKTPGEEPFDLQNNLWRIKPSKKETDAAIHQRLKENLHFFILFYKSAIIKDDKEVSFWGLPSCFTWYGGGIYIKNEKELKENWINCFYNKEQAMKAYALAEKLMEKKYTWLKNERNWLKQNLYVLEQMYKNLDELH